MHDDDCRRNGTTNLFVAVEPKAGQRIVAVTEHRGKIDFVAFVDSLLCSAYAKWHAVDPHLGHGRPRISD